MNELVAWLRNQLREDELAVFKADRDDTDNLWKHQRNRGHRDYLIRFADPKTVRADIEAKRAVIDEYESAARFYATNTSPMTPDVETRGLRTAITLLARGYRHRGGWKQEWE